MTGTEKLYPRTGDRQTIYLKSTITDPSIVAGDYTMYNDSVNDLVGFEGNNVLYHYPINHDHLIMGKFYSIACDAEFLFNSANHILSSLSTYSFPLFFEEWGLERGNVGASWGSKGDIVTGNDAWIGYGVVVMAEATIGDRAIIGSRAVATKDVPPYTITGDVPAKPIRRRYSGEAAATLLELKWWDWPEERITKNIHAVQTGQLNRLI